MSDERTRIYDLSFIVGPETEDGRRSVVLREDDRVDHEGPVLIESDDRVEVNVVVHATEREDGASIGFGSELFVEVVPTDEGGVGP